MFLRDKDWAQVVKTTLFLHHYFTLGYFQRKKRVSAQPKPISEVVKDFEQSLENLRPSTKRVYVGRGDRGTMLRCLLALLARLERAAGPAGSTAVLPQIFPMEPVKTPFPRTQRRSLGPSSPAQRSAATQPGRRAQQHRAHHSGKIRVAFLGGEPLKGGIRL